jgi:hypothetical protein
VVVAARPTTPADGGGGGGAGALECLTPATEGWRGRSATLWVSPSTPAGLIGGELYKLNP